MIWVRITAILIVLSVTPGPLAGGDLQPPDPCTVVVPLAAPVVEPLFPRAVVAPPGVVPPVAPPVLPTLPVAPGPPVAPDIAPPLVPVEPFAVPPVVPVAALLGVPVGNAETELL